MGDNTTLTPSAIKGVTFSGLPNENIEAFFVQMELRFEGLKCKEDWQKIQATFQSLKRKAATWIAPIIAKYGVGKDLITQYGGNDENGQPIIVKQGPWDSLKKFKQWLRLKHGKFHDPEQQAARQIFTIQQKGADIVVFNDEFESLRMHLDPKKYTNEVLLIAYKWGIRPDIKNRLSINPESENWTIDEYMKNAQIIEGTRTFNKDQSSHLPKYKDHGKPSYHVYDDDKMDVDTGVFKQMVGNKETRKCFNCGTTGHLAKTCRKAKRSGKQNKNRFRSNFSRNRSMKRNEIKVTEDRNQDEDDNVEEELEHF